MVQTLLQLHSLWRYVVLLLVVITALRAVFALLAGHRWNNTVDTRLLSYTRYAVYVQVVLGILLYVTRQGWTRMTFTMEHVITMVVAVGVLEFTAGRVKKARGKKMHQITLIGFVVAFVLIFAGLQIVGGLF